MPYHWPRGVVNARGIPTYLRQFLFMADPPSPQSKRGRSFSLIGIELLFPFINDAGNRPLALRTVITTVYVFTTRKFTRQKEKNNKKPPQGALVRETHPRVERDRRCNDTLAERRVITVLLRGVIFTETGAQVNGTENNMRAA